MRNNFFILLVMMIILLSYYFKIGKGHTFALSQSVGIQTKNPSFDGFKLDGLPDGVIHNVRELALGYLSPVSPVG
jgi:hypothetical protein